ncbi:MAG: type II toxin-antitoxin system RelE/ParE family toxin [Verrucomicrobiales bacterium]
MIFHRLVQRDLSAILKHYENEGGEKLAERFFTEIEAVIAPLRENPQRFHFVQADLRRADLPSFPYHFLYQESPRGIPVLVLRHDRRHPDYGMSRR